MKRIAVVTCWIGRLPDWFILWVKSVEFNETIDYYLYTDQDLNIQIPQNLILQKTNLKELKNRFSNALGFECILESSYKLCDYKPLYGEAFKEQLKGYDFWGHCDLDMIFGDLRKFITEDILDEYERIFEVGHLSLYKNIPRINRMYKEEGGLFSYIEVFHNKHYCGFDEHTGITRIFESNGIRTYKKVVCADIDPHYKAFYMMDEDSVDNNSVKNYCHQIFTWENGRTYRIFLNDSENCVCRDEISYIHFMRKNPGNASKCVESNKFIITYDSFIPYKGDIDKDSILKFDHSTAGIIKKCEYISGFIKNGIKAYKRNELWLRIKLRIGRIKTINKFMIKEHKNER